MSILSGKKVLIVGEENAQISALVNELKQDGAHIQSKMCEAVTTSNVEADMTDVIIVNHLNDEDTCRAMLLSLRDARFNKLIPVFVLVDGTEDKIQEAYAFGAADYISPDESVADILAKIKGVIGQENDFSEVSVIDITPEEVDVTRKGIRVYVIEDDPLLRNLLSIKLEKTGFPYEFSSDGRNVVEIMQQFKPDIVILDLMLPGKSGFDVLAEIKSNDALKSIPVIVFSNRDGQDDKHKAKELGAVGFYVKAMTDLSDLIETIESHVA